MTVCHNFKVEADQKFGNLTTFCHHARAHSVKSLVLGGFPSCKYECPVFLAQVLFFIKCDNMAKVITVIEITISKFLILFALLKQI